MLGRAPWVIALLAPLAVGCSAIVDTDADELGGDGNDSDSGIRLMRDAGPQPDGGPGGDDGGPGGDDAGDGCSGPPRCEGDTRVACVGGELVEQACENGCSDGVCRPEPTGSCDEATPLEPGLRMFDICTDEDDSTHLPSEQCGESDADGPDRVFTFTLDHAANVVIDLSDADRSVAIDTILYLRRQCDVEESQVACHDDVPCTSTTIACSVGERVQVRQARISTRLEAGTYYVFADTYRYERNGTEFDCGDVRLYFESGGTGGL